jgi:hypothetical protein
MSPPAVPPEPADAAGAEVNGAPQPDGDSVVKGLNETARRRISYVLLGLGVGLLLVSFAAILFKTDVARNAIGIPIAAGLAIVFVGFMGGRAEWGVKTIGLSLGGGIAAFAGVYHYFFYDGHNAECAFSMQCKAPSIALQFIHTIEGQGPSAEIMDCLRVTTGNKVWQKVEMNSEPGSIPNGNQYFLHQGNIGNIGEIDIGGRSSMDCQGRLNHVRVADSSDIYRMQRLRPMMADTSEKTLEVTYLASNDGGVVPDSSGKKTTKTFRAGELIIVTVYLAPQKPKPTN